MRPINPYTVGNPIREQAHFFGRQDIFREVMQVLRQRDSNAIVLYGQRRIGKTSMLLQLEQRLAHEGEFTPIYFDLQDKASKSLPELLYELAQYITRVTRHIVQQPDDFSRTGDYFRDIFLPEVVSKVASGGLVLLFDEFDVLDSPARTQASQAFFPYLRTWMENVQKVKFVFVIGRRPEELSIRSMSTFKGIQSTRVSFMSRKDTEAVIRQSEASADLKWEPMAAERVYELTHGHPYFTQLLCSVVWENNHENDDEDKKGILTATQDEVDKAVNQALKMGANAFNWLWDGLPPAERVVMSAMAEVKDEIITQEQLIETLNQSGVRLIARELELAPETLMDWELLYRVEDGYRFAVPLLRKWVLANRPLRRVKDELDRLDPLADTLFQAGQGFYNSNRPENAEQQLRQALNINPNHLKARLLLGRILLDQARLAESVEVLETAYQYDERSARADLLKSLLALAESQAQEEDKQLEIYERILAIQPDQPLAREKRQSIWVRRGDTAFEKGDFDQAVKAYETVGYQAGIDNVASATHEKNWKDNLRRVESFVTLEQWQEALSSYERLLVDFPEKEETIQSSITYVRGMWRDALLKAVPAYIEEENWQQVVVTCDPLLKEFPDDSVIIDHLKTAREQLGLSQRYHEALGALEAGKNDKARKLFSEIVAENPAFGKASLKLVEAIYGKVKISIPVLAGTRLLTYLTSLLWTIIPTFMIAYMLYNLLAPRFGRLYFENLFVIEFTIVLFGFLIFYANNVIDVAHEIERGKLSFGKAIWTHALYGMGLFYVDRSARRKWLYAVVAFLIPALILIQIIYTPMTTNNSLLEPMEFSNGSKVMERWEIIFIIVLLAHGLSFVDVLFNTWTQRNKRSMAKSSIDNRRGTNRLALKISPTWITKINLSGGQRDWLFSVLPWLPLVGFGFFEIETKFIWLALVCMGMGILVTRSVASVKSNEQGFTTIASVFALTPFAFGSIIGFIIRNQAALGINVYGDKLAYSYPIIALLINSYWAIVKKAPANISASAALVGIVSGFWIAYYTTFIYRTSSYFGQGLYELATLPLVSGILVTILFLATNGLIGGLISLLWLVLMLGPFVALYFVSGGANWSYSMAGFLYGLVATLITAFIVWLEQFIITRWQARHPKKAKGA